VNPRLGNTLPVTGCDRVRVGPARLIALTATGVESIGASRHVESTSPFAPARVGEPGATCPGEGRAGRDAGPRTANAPDDRPPGAGIGTLRRSSPAVARPGAATSSCSGVVGRTAGDDEEQPEGTGKAGSASHPTTPFIVGVDARRRAGRDADPSQLVTRYALGETGGKCPWRVSRPGLRRFTRPRAECATAIPEVRHVDASNIPLLHRASVSPPPGRCCGLSWRPRSAPLVVLGRATK
jgi:hypothetical protein